MLAVPSFHGLMPALPPQLITAGKRRDCIRLRGLPYEASVNDIVTFLGDYSRQIVTQGVHLIYSAEVRATSSTFRRKAYITIRAGNGSLELTHDPLTHLICDP